MVIIKHHPVVSSNLHSAGYDKNSKTLEITFKNGATYTYSNVPQEMYEGIFQSDSPGNFVHKWIAKGRYKFKKSKK